MEQKKRWRPSLTAYRELERKVEFQNEILSQIGNFEQIVIDNAIYRQALVNFTAMIENRKDPAMLVQGSSECQDLISMVDTSIRKRWDEKADELYIENKTLIQSNRHMEQELKLLRSKIGLQEEVADNRAAEVERMRSRGFWSRVFNR